jgi:acyl-CoA synthetase (AMP-forming)/AMP-acid ligase II
VAWHNLADGSDLTFATWDADANRLARGLGERGLAPGERVVIGVGPDEPFPWLIAYTAVHRAGAVAVPVNTRLAGAELRRILDHAEPTVVLASASTDAGESWTGLAAGASGLRVLATTGDDRDWSAQLHADASPLPTPPGDGGTSDIMYTSGTTGSAKAVVVRHRPPDPSDPSGTGWVS